MSVRLMVDLAINWDLMRLRARMLQSIRAFFNARDFLEVDAPCLTPYPSLDSNIESMRVMKGQPNIPALYLHTSPEHAMKKLLAAGGERIFYLGKVFRDDPLTFLHNPEFTMAEWYRVNADFRDIQNDTEELIRHIAGEVFETQSIQHSNLTVDLHQPWRRIKLNDLFIERTGLNLQRRSIDDFRHYAVKEGIHFEPSDDWQTLFFRIYLHGVEQNLGCGTPLFIYEYPSEMALMAKTTEIEGSTWAERTELYIAGTELANGYTECTDRDEIKSRFLDEQALRTSDGGKEYPIDNELLSAISGMPESAGMALGVDRLFMLFTGITRIQDILYFPLHNYSDNGRSKGSDEQ